MSTKGWIAVDLDGTLAEYHGWKGERHIGPPIPTMLARVKRWLADGLDVRIFTARISADGGDGRDVAEVRGYIERWCAEHIGWVLPITNVKDQGMVTLYDDRCIRVERNTGRLINAEEE